MRLSIKLNNAAQLVALYSQAPAIAAKEYRDGLERVAAFVTREAKRNAPVNKNKGGGNLRQSIKYQSDPGTGGFIVWVNASYGAAVDQGSAPHVILPRNKKFLAFKGRDGNWVYAKRVNHPGQKATHFFSNAVESAGPYGNIEMTRAMGRVLNRLSTGDK